MIRTRCCTGIGMMKMLYVPGTLYPTVGLG